MSSHSLAEDDFDGFYGTDEEEEAGFLVDLLFDLLSEYCPKGYYFGAHPGDGVDYGVWRIEHL